MRSVRSSTTQHKDAGHWGEQILKQKNIMNIFFSLQFRKITNYSYVPTNTETLNELSHKQIWIGISAITQRLFCTIKPSRFTLHISRLMIR